MPEPVLSIKDLTVEFQTEDGVVHAVDGLSYDLYPGETLGVVGESGSGKSVSMLSILGLIPQGRIVRGEAWYKGKSLMKMKRSELRKLRGGELSMIFQDPMTSLNPVLTIGFQIDEALAGAQSRHQQLGVPDARHRAARASSACRTPSSATTSIRTSSRAACASER